MSVETERKLNDVMHIPQDPSCEPCLRAKAQAPPHRRLQPQAESRVVPRLVIGDVPLAQTCLARRKPVILRRPWPWLTLSEATRLRRVVFGADVVLGHIGKDLIAKVASSQSHDLHGHRFRHVGV